MVNKIFLVGNLGKTPETRTLENGTKVAKFSIATNENYKDKSGEWQTETQWHNVVAWRQLADKAERLKKGEMLYVEGKLTHRTYEKDGEKRYSTEIVANYFRLLSKREESQSTGQEQSGDDDMPF